MLWLFISAFTEWNKRHKQATEKKRRKVQGVPQSQTAALHRHQKEEETDKTKQA